MTTVAKKIEIAKRIRKTDWTQTLKSMKIGDPLPISVGEQKTVAPRATELKNKFGFVYKVGYNDELSKLAIIRIK